MTTNCLQQSIRIAINMAILVSAWQPGPCQERPPAAQVKGQERLIRIDFRVEGASCAACLMRIEEAMRMNKCVKKVGISIYKPFPAVVILACPRRAFDEIAASIKRTEPAVRFVVIKEQPVQSVPAVLLPVKGSDGH